LKGNLHENSIPFWVFEMEFNQYEEFELKKKTNGTKNKRI
jgi:hypothetical protein